MTMSLEGFPVFFEVFWKSGVALGAALCVNAMLRKKSADVRRRVISTAIFAMFAAVSALPALPRWTTVTPGWLQVFSPAAPPFPKLSAQSVKTGAGAESIAPVIRAMRLGTEPRTVPSALSLSWIRGVIPLVWFIGAALFLARFVVSLLGLNRLRHTSEAVTDPNC